MNEFLQQIKNYQGTYRLMEEIGYKTALLEVYSKIKGKGLELEKEIYDGLEMGTHVYQEEAEELLTAMEKLIVEKRRRLFK